MDEGGKGSPVVSSYLSLHCGQFSMSECYSFDLEQFLLQILLCVSVNLTVVYAALSYSIIRKTDISGILVGGLL